MSDFKPGDYVRITGNTEWVRKQLWLVMEASTIFVRTVPLSVDMEDYRSHMIFTYTPGELIHESALGETL